MNTKSIRFILGWILNIEALLMLLPVATAVLYREEEGIAYVEVLCHAAQLFTVSLVKCALLIHVIPLPSLSAFSPASGASSAGGHPRLTAPFVSMPSAPPLYKAASAPR